MMINKKIGLNFNIPFRLVMDKAEVYDGIEK